MELAEGDNVGMCFFFGGVGQGLVMEMGHLAWCSIFLCNIEYKLLSIYLGVLMSCHPDISF